MNLQTFLLITLLEAILPNETSSILRPKQQQQQQHQQLQQQRRRRRLVWHDEFNGNHLNDLNWKYEQHCGRFNNELQCYTDHRSANARVQNGRLIIEARPEHWNNNWNGKQFNFTSARLLSKQSWTYGRFNIRARMPKGLHLWPAIWMLAKHETYGDWPTNGEIDIVELIGNQAQLMSSSIHYGPTEESLISLTSGLKNFGVDLSKNFHIYSLDWTRKRITWLFDGRPYFSINLDRYMCCKSKSKSSNKINPNIIKTSSITSPYWKKGQPFDRPFYFILNIAVGGTFFGQPPYVTMEQAKKFWQKNTMEIDYIRVFQ